MWSKNVTASKETLSHYSIADQSQVSVASAYDVEWSVAIASSVPTLIAAFLDAGQCRLRAADSDVKECGVVSCRHINQYGTGD